VVITSNEVEVPLNKFRIEISNPYKINIESKFICVRRW